MLRDEVRTGTYRKAILQNKDVFRGKIVMDVGCGTGILCLFAAEAGASKVIGIDCASKIDRAKTVVEDNNFDDVITLIKGKLEDVTLPDGIDQVDIIISEWMGYCLLFESMLNVVLLARDKWLKPDGYIFPDKCQLYVTAIEGESCKLENANFWDCVQGYDMSCMSTEPVVSMYAAIISPEKMATNMCLIKDIDLNTVSMSDLVFEAPYHVQCNRDCSINGFITYFDVEFTPCNRPTGFSTAPDATLTHWKQTMFLFWNSNINVKKGDSLFGIFNLQTNKHNKRSLFIKIDVNRDGNAHQSPSLLYKNQFVM